MIGWLSLAGFFITTAAGVWYGLHIGLQRADWASWFQAVGAVFAILWAFWLYGSDRRRVQSQEKELAYVMAVLVYRKLVRLITLVEKHRDVFASADDTQMDMDCFVNFREELAMSPYPTLEETIALRYILKEQTAVLTNGIAYVEDSYLLSAVLPSGSDSGTYKGRLRHAKNVMELLNSSLARLVQISNILGKYAVV